MNLRRFGVPPKDASRSKSKKKLKGKRAAKLGASGNEGGGSADEMQPLVGAAVDSLAPSFAGRAPRFSFRDNPGQPHASKWWTDPWLAMKGSHKGTPILSSSRLGRGGLSK